VGAWARVWEGAGGEGGGGREGRWRALAALSPPGAAARTLSPVSVFTAAFTFPKVPSPSVLPTMYLPTSTDFEPSSGPSAPAAGAAAAGGLAGRSCGGAGRGGRARKR
jgi:hypothetical protein